ncbi:MAG: TRAP transporter substrate-binding protein DctP [Deltaproteobacteria bacterium]|nr:TRAP transporter substrate-binding protein DctP [Deltaproteobacteria bacterium]
MSRHVRLLAAALLLVWMPARHASADEPKHKLRIATAAPDDTSWAHAFHQFARMVSEGTHGEVEIKFYYGGIAGDEAETHRLMDAGKLDGVVSGGPLCDDVIPSMRALGIVGLFQSQDEATYVLNQLRPAIDKEAHASGYLLLTTGSIGPVIMFTREPITSMAELQKTKLWSWDLNKIFLKEVTELNLSVEKTSIETAQKAFDTKRIDGYLTTPVAALAFQWYVGTKYITDLRTGYLMGCFLLRESAVDELTPEQQAVVRKAGTKLGIKIESDNREQDAKLLGGVYASRGLKLVPVSKKFRAEFFEAARSARQRLGEALLPRGLYEQVVQLLADYRAEHG